MDFDPGFFQEDPEDAYEAGHEEGYEEGFDDARDTEAEYDENGNVLAVGIGFGAAAGFGYEAAKDEIDERQLAEKHLKKRKDEPEMVKVPLSSRHGSREVKGKPFERWLHDFLSGKKKITDPLEYTPEERAKFRSEW